MIVERSMHASYLSNAWLLGDKTGGTGVVIDTGAPIEPLIAAVVEHGLTVTHVLNTHEHHDHTIHNVELQERFSAELVLPDALRNGWRLAVGDLELEALETPGHTQEHFGFRVGAAPGRPADAQFTGAVFTGDVLFKGSVGGTLNGGPDGFAQLRRSVMDVLMKLPPETRVFPGHTDETTIGAEWDTNPFVRLWRGVDTEGTEDVEVTGKPAILLLKARDYDGGHKAWVRFHRGGEAVVGGGMVQRVGART